MSTKTKTIIAVITIFILTVVFVAFYLKKQNTLQSKPDLQEEQADFLQQEQIKDLEKQLKDAQNVNTVTIEGSVIKTDEKLITIKNADTENIITLNDKVVIFALDNNLAEIKKIEDLKNETKVKMEVSTKDSTVISVEILK